MLVRLAKIGVGVPPLGSPPFRVIIECLLSEEYVVFLVEPHKPADKDFGFISGTNFVDVLS